MRIAGAFCVAIAAVSTAVAQPPETDGRAILANPAGDYFTAEGTRLPAGKEHVRAAIGTLMENGKIDPRELDFLKEIAAQAPFTLSIDGVPGGLNVPPATNEAVALAKLLINPPNMHTLWNGDTEKTEQLVELSRWGPTAQQRVANFFGSKLYDAWTQSNVLNAFAPFVDTLGRQWNAVKGLSDPAAVRAGKQLLIDGCEIAKQKAAGEGKVPPENFLCAWMPASL